MRQMNWDDRHDHWHRIYRIYDGTMRVRSLAGCTSRFRRIALDAATGSGLSVLGDWPGPDVTCKEPKSATGFVQAM
jgi:hypothetical protein